MARKAKAVEVTGVIGRYCKHDRHWVVAFDKATEMYDTGTVVTVKPLEKDAHKVIIKALVASSIVLTEDEDPTLYYTYTKVSAK
jgi:sugar lactone lactonase YvrE